MAPATINRELVFLGRAFNVAKEKPVLSQKKGGVFAKENHARVRYLSDDEEQRLHGAAFPDAWAPVTVALHTGFRRSNVFRLHWAEDVNFGAGTIRAYQPKGGTDYFVPMNGELRTVLRALRQRQGPDQPASEAGDGGGHAFGGLSFLSACLVRSRPRRLASPARESV